MRWEPSASIEALRYRASVQQRIRQFFLDHHYLEVETPIMAHHGTTDIYLQNIEAYFRGERYFLQTSPEYHMKRLLAAGSGPIFQFSRVFRDDELGRWHNPEFTMLEWYRLNIDHHALMDEVDLLLSSVLGLPVSERMTYQEVFEEICGIDPFHTTTTELRNVARRYAIHTVLTEDETDIDQYLFLLMSHCIEPALGKRSTPTMIYHFPPSQAALAQVNHGVAERFEVYYRGVELANGFHELTDPTVQRARFETDIQLRSARGLPLALADEFFLQALEIGLPSCSGVALGIDRLLAVCLDQPSIANVMAFDFSIS